VIALPSILRLISFKDYNFKDYVCFKLYLFLFFYIIVFVFVIALLNFIFSIKDF
jgi:hypothetical protein